MTDRTVYRVRRDFRRLETARGSPTRSDRLASQLLKHLPSERRHPMPRETAIQRYLIQRPKTMLQNIRKSRGGFTLVEIMIVVAIIALLAAIAVPGFLRARKRSQATSILNDARVIDGAIDQYAIENNKKGTDAVTAQNIKAFFKPGSRLYNQAATASTVLSDIIGNNYTYATFDSGVHVNTATTANFTDVIDTAGSFWGAYMQ